MKTFTRLFIGLLAVLLTLPALAAEPKSLFYLVSGPKSVQSFLSHVDKIDIVVPTWYTVDGDGLVSGAANATVMASARQHGVEVMPIFTPGAGPEGYNALVANPRAQDLMNQALVRIAKTEGYSGFQFDFEGVSYLKRDAFTALVTRTAAALHQAGLKISIAVVPNAPGYFAGSTAFGRWMWTDWRGMFDLPRLAKVVDLICLMTYDQNTRWTTPGPVDGLPWVQRQLDYALKYVPADKLSLGIPLYGYHWFTGDPNGPDGKARPNISGDYIDYDESMPLANAFHAQVQWDAQEAESWFYFYRDDMREWVFMPDKRSFSIRYQIVQRQHLQGFCSWVLGAEDPAIWDVLPVVHH
ncbi:glycosyl hydrolase family 18 protein [Frateuria aurantia]